MHNINVIMSRLPCCLIIIAWQRSLVWEVITPLSKEWFFTRWSVNQLHVALVRVPLTPKPKQIRTSCLLTTMDSTWQLESSLLCCCVTPRLLFSLRLGYDFGVWQERDSGIWGTILAIFFFFFFRKRESWKSKVGNDTPFLFQSVGYLFKPEVFVLV